MSKAAWSVVAACGSGFLLSALIFFVLLQSASQTALLTSGKTDFKVPRAGAPTGFEQLNSTQLIDKLQEVATEGVGIHSTAWGDAFLAIDEEPKFMGGILGSAKPVVSPIMRELVRRGIAILPDLIEHLADSRPTKLVIKHECCFGSMWHGEEYSLRFYNPEQAFERQFASHQKNSRENQRLAQYTIRVGDLCYVAIGQIVNRRLNAIRYQPTACIVINSPVETPELAVAVKQDWAGLTIEQHILSLRQDAYSKDPFTTADLAMKRLAFYYPVEAEQLALDLLARPLYPLFKPNPFALKDQNPVTLRNQTALVESLAGLQSVKLEQAIHKVFQTAIQIETYYREDQVAVDNLSFACMSALIGKGYDQEFRAFIDKRISQEGNLPAWERAKPVRMDSKEKLAAWWKRLNKQ